MRLRFAALLAVIFILIVLVSCKSTETAPVFSDEEIAHTMYYILQQSEDKAVTSLFQNLNAIKEPMIPEQYIVMNDIRGEIPGMERLLSDWAIYTTSFIIPLYDGFTDYTVIIAENQIFPDPQALLESGTTSVSLYMRRLHLGEMVQIIRPSIVGLDLDYWRQAVTQYNAWVNTRAVLSGQEANVLPSGQSDEELLDIFAAHLADLYFKYLSSAEVMIRTTPDPEMDQTAARVLGLV